MIWSMTSGASVLQGSRAWTVKQGSLPVTPILVWRGAPVSMIKVSLLFIVFVPMDSQDQDVR